MELFSVKKAIENAFIKSKKLKVGFLKAYWDKVADRVSSRTTPLYIKEEVLYVAVEDSIYLHHMSMNKSRYLSKISELLKSDEIKDIRFKVGKVDLIEWKRDDEEESGEIGRETESELINLSLEEKIDVLRKKSLIREKKLFDKGYKKCSRCGNMFLGTKQRCDVCSIKREKDWEEKDDNK